jgi:hypothetical protein
MKLYDMVHKYGWDVLAILPSIPNIRAEGNIFFVDSGATNAYDAADGVHGHSWEVPFATLNFAISQCTEDQGDVILLAPGHAESLSTTATASGTTTTEVGVDKAGISIYGLGSGSLRPTFTCTATAGQIAVLAANVTIENIIMVGNIANLTDMITLDASSDGCTIRNCEFRDGAADKEVVAMIDIATTVNDLLIEGCRFFSTDTNDAGLAAIRFAGTGARAIIRNNVFRGDFNTSAILGTAGIMTDVLIENNYLNNIDAAANYNCISLNAAATGVIVRNLMHAGTANTAGLAAAACMCCENYCTCIEAESGNLCPAAGDWAS